jgi:membrane associated rhomboid family serine protease
VVNGTGQRLGHQLKGWMEAGGAGLESGQALGNRLVDALGADDSLKGPIRDLASQRLLLQALHQEGAAQRSALSSLAEQLASTYAPAVLQELLDLLETATGVAMPRQPAQAALSQSDPKPKPSLANRGWGAFAQELRPLAPGLVLAAGGALVLSWASRELDRELFEGLGWSGGVVLVVVLGLLQALALGPLKRWRRSWILNEQSAGDPRQAWRWLAAPWMHANSAEAAVNLVALLILLGASALQLGDVVLRYSLTALATLMLSAVMAQRFGVARTWSGASGAISALIALGASLSVLHWRQLSFNAGPIAIPAWVLLLVYRALQLGWQLPRQNDGDASRPLERLLSCQWWWGLVLGVLWGLISWGQSWLQASAG